MVNFLISVFLMGVVVGYLARLLVPGPDPMTLLQTVLLGMVGSFVGGGLGYLIFSYDSDEGIIQPAGFFGSLAGSILALLVYNRFFAQHRIRQDY